jgi:flavin-dependent dehydrogenase
VTEVNRDGETFTVGTAGGATLARVLLIAAGGECRLGTAVGLTSPAARMAPALEIEGCARSRLLDPRAILFDYRIPGGYAWAFPKAERWNIGVLTTRSHPGAALRRHLHRVIAEWEVDFDGDAAARATGRRIPMWCGRRALHSGRAALLGDAAALADPFFGEGIAGALLSGPGGGGGGR